MRLTARAYTIPTDVPEGDGTIAWSSTTLVLAEASGDGIAGIGWTYGPAAVASIITDLLAPVVLAIDPDDTPAAWLAMQQRLRNAGRPGVAGSNSRRVASDYDCGRVRPTPSPSG